MALRVFIDGFCKAGFFLFGQNCALYAVQANHLVANGGSFAGF